MHEMQGVGMPVDIQAYHSSGAHNLANLSMNGGMSIGNVGMSIPQSSQGAVNGPLCIPSPTSQNNFWSRDPSNPTLTTLHSINGLPQYQGMEYLASKNELTALAMQSGNNNLVGNSGMLMSGVSSGINNNTSPYPPNARNLLPQINHNIYSNAHMYDDQLALNAMTSLAWFAMTFALICWISLYIIESDYQS